MKQDFFVDIMSQRPLYQELLLEHYRSPRNKGVLFGYTISGGSYNPSCGDELSIQAVVENDVLTVIMFQGKGCIVSQAAGSLFTEKIVGMTLVHIMQLSAQDMQKLLSIELGPTRLRCALLVLESVQKAIAVYRQAS